MNHQNDAMTVTQAARTLGVHRRTIDRLIANGSLRRSRQTKYLQSAEVLTLRAARAEAAYQQIREHLIRQAAASGAANIRHALRSEHR